MDGRRPARPGGEPRQVTAAFAGPNQDAALFQLLTSFGPFGVACVAMYAVYPLSPLLGVACALLAGMLVVRVFIVQHDCGHGSFLGSRRANALVGRACSLVTMTPFASWARQHSLHHRHWSSLERRRGADLYSACLTVREYLALSPLQRFLHRLPRHPLVSNLLLPPLIFVLLYRLPFDTPRRWTRERRSIALTNVALLALHAALAGLLGWERVLVLQFTTMVVASTLGVWLFTLQHRFDTALWTSREHWTPSHASLQGSSWLKLPCVLQWLTGNIGFHHVHHLDTRVPSYRLPAAHDAVQAVWPVTPLGIRGGLAAPWLTLWDEKGQRLVSFRTVDRGGARGAGAGRTAPEAHQAGTGGRPINT